MDIVTHALMGTALVSPLAADHPLEACAFVLGSVLPDMDAFSRVLGRRAFLAAHQTWSHSIPLILLLGAAAHVWLAWQGSVHAHLPSVIAAGMVLHSLLDLTNTYGVTALAPFSSRRFSLEWIFFIDAPVLAGTAAALLTARAYWQAGEAVPPGVGLGYAGGCLAYWALRAWMRRRAGRMAPPDTLSLIPSALWPWRYLGCRAGDQGVGSFELDLLRGAVGETRWTPILDGRYRELLEALPEYRVMKDLSPAYHAVRAERDGEGERVTCRDLRTRNFGGRFGQLDVLVVDGVARETVFHV